MNPSFLRLWAKRSRLLFCKERREQIAQSRSLKWSILSKRAEREFPTLVKRIHCTVIQSYKGGWWWSFLSWPYSYSFKCFLDQRYPLAFITQHFKIRQRRSCLLHCFNLNKAGMKSWPDGCGCGSSPAKCVQFFFTAVLYSEAGSILYVDK